MNLLNTEDTYKALQPFQTVEELNANTKAIREQYADQMTPSTYRVLDALARYACKYPGVSYRSKAKIAAELGIDRKTVTRACAALEALGVVKQYATNRASGDRRRSTDAIVFVRVIAEVPAECPDQEAPAKTIKISNYTRDTDKPAESDILKRGLLSKLPKELGQTLGVFFDVPTIHRLYGVMLRAKSSVDRLMAFESNESEYNCAIMSVISAWKRGKVRSLDAVIYEATRRIARKLWLRDTFEEYMAQ